MTQEITEQVMSYFLSPLNEGEKRKILYLYDPDCSYEDRFKSLSDESEKFVLLHVTDHNYFKIQYQIEREFAKDNLFLYFSMEKPDPRENPLLDVLFYSEELKIDKESQLFLSIGIDPIRDDLAAIVENYPAFFKSKTRLNSMKTLWNKVSFDTLEAFEYSILGALVKAPYPDWMSVWIALFEDEVNGNNRNWDQLFKFGNVNRFWELVDKLVGYNEETSVQGKKSIPELMKQVFLTNLNAELEGMLPNELTDYVLDQANPIVVFMNQWMNSKNKENHYQTIANAIQDQFDMDQLFKDFPSKTLSQLETFQWFDQELIQRLVNSLGSLEKDEALSWITQRKNTFWFETFSDIYQFLEWSFKFIWNVEAFEENFHSVRLKEEMLDSYTNEYYQIDQTYRKVHSLFEKLDDEWKDIVSNKLDELNRVYTKQYLDPFTDKWDQFFKQDVSISEEHAQNTFYEKEVSPFVDSEHRIVVIISDGLRYEAGEELYRRLINEKRFNGELEWMQSGLPSISSLGMASLLPHGQIYMSNEGNILIDGKKREGLVERQKQLDERTQKNTLIVRLEELLSLNRMELRNILQSKKVIYIYHDYIDAIGDSQKTENDVFRATDSTIEHIWRLMNRLTVEISVNQFLVTADHGYLYNRDKLRASEKAIVDVEEECTVKNKRYLITKEKLHETIGISLPIDKGLKFDGYITVPRGMNRFALRGGGSQYVHGGHLPQEVIVPLLKIKTERGRNELDKVDVTLVTQTRRITHSVIWISLLQTEPVTDIKRERQLKLYFEDENGEIISNEVGINTDSDALSSDQRVFTEKFVLLNKSYERYGDYYFVLEDEKSGKEIERQKFEIDII